MTSRFHRTACALFCLALAGTAAAQSNTSGNITGNAAPGDTVIINGADTGIHREVEIKKEGKYRVRGLPTGDYTVMIKHADGTVGPAATVSLRVGSTVNVP